MKSTFHWLRFRKSILLLAALVLGELCLRLAISNGHFSPPVFIANADGDYVLQKKISVVSHQYGRNIRISIDEDGHRTTIGQNQTGNVVHLVGDSQVFGWGLDDTETISSGLQELLGSSWSVVNHGLPGKGPLDYFELSSKLDPDDFIVVFLTEENDLWDLYDFGQQVQVSCGFLRSIELSLLNRLPCTLKNLRLVQASVTLLDDSSHRYRPTPIGFSHMSSAASAPLLYRLNRSIEALRGGMEGAKLQFATVPWKGRWPEISDKEIYSPPPYDYDELPFYFTDEFEIYEAFKNERNRESLYLARDSHVSPNGSALIARQLANRLLENSN